MKKIENLRLFYAAILCAVFIFTVGSAQFAKAATFTVSNTNDAGGGSLREAITLANAGSDMDNIYFGLSAGAKIAPLSPLPTIVNPVTIDGNNGNASQFPRIELSGENAGGTAIGLWISASNCTIRGLIINRFQNGGIRIDTGSNNTVALNWIGIDSNGTAALPNINRGVLIVGSTGNTIGGTNYDVGLNIHFDRNVISGNSGNGISITGGGSATVIGNYIGTDRLGTADLGNTSHGVQIVNSSNSVIGGTGGTATRNVISGNNATGVSILTDFGFTAANNVVRGNYIGVNSGGNTALGNSSSGVLIQAGNNTIGSAFGGTGANIIGGNSANGIAISTSFATGNTIVGNSIGVGANGTANVGNTQSGIRITNLAAGNVIGGTGVTQGSCNNSCNLIANNGAATSIEARAGIYVDATGGARNAIRQNSIFGNGTPFMPPFSTFDGIGIDLAAGGTTANDAGDPDTGPNNTQNFPILSSAETNGSIIGSLNSTANSMFAIDFYSNPAADGAFSEGRTFIGSTTLTTDGSGSANFSYGSTATLTAGEFVTATATSTGGLAQAVGDTSEFSAAQTVIASTATPQGLEADVASRPNGSGDIQSNDVVQMRRFLNEIDTPSTSPNEFQRADSAPRATRGDGNIDSSDIVQTIRYLNELDGLQTAGGPTAPSGGKPSLDVETVISGKTTTKSGTVSAPQVAPELRVENASGSAGNPVTVNIRVDAVGNESQYGFAVLFDPNVLSYANFAAGETGAATFSCNTTATAGRVRCDVGGFPNDQPGSSTPVIKEIAPGNDQLLIKVIFNVAANAAANSTTAVRLGSASASDDAANSISPATTNGTVTITGPTAAGATVGGRVQNEQGRGVANAQIVMFNREGERLTARTNGFGYFRFTDVPSGETYTVTVKSKQYRFTPKVVNVTQDLDDVNFVAQPSQ